MKRTKRTPKEKAAIAFFYKHAGWNYRAGRETEEQGRQRGARTLAKAEQRADAAGVTFRWEDDDQPFACDCDRKHCPSREPHQAYGCILLDADDEAHDSLWGISFGPGGEPFPYGRYGPPEPYARVVQAELAIEYFEQLDKDQAGPDDEAFRAAVAGGLEPGELFKLDVGGAVQRAGGGAWVAVRVWVPASEADGRS